MNETHPNQTESVEVPVRDDANELGSFERAGMTLAALAGIGVEPTGRKIVDLGAGYGSLSIACAPVAESVLAVDIAADQLAVLAERAASEGVDVTTRAADLLNDSFSDIGADLAFMFGVAEYAGLWDLSSDVESLQRRVFKSCFESLAPGGRFVFGSKNRAWPSFVLKDIHTNQPLVNVLPRGVADRLSAKMGHGPYRQHIHTPKGWKRLIESAGFVNVRTYAPYLSYQFPLLIVERPSLDDIGRLGHLETPAGAEKAVWGRFGRAKALSMALLGSARIPLSQSVIITAERP